MACHTVSRNGGPIAVDIGGSALGVYNVKDRSPVANPSTNIATAWTTFNPDNSRIVTASKGVLTLRDGATGAVDVLAPPPPPPDGGTGQCVPTLGADCSSAPCCDPNYCSSTNGGPPYFCQMIIG